MPSWIVPQHLPLSPPPPPPPPQQQQQQQQPQQLQPQQQLCGYYATRPRWFRPARADDAV
jgi:hypothetical protein